MNNISLNLGKLNQEQTLLVLKTMELVAPMECELVGKNTLSRILLGYNFRQLSYGNHIDFMETISFLSSIATLTQIAIICGSWIGKKHQENSIKQQVRVDDFIKHPKISESKELIELIEKNISLLQTIISSLETIEKQSRDNNSGDSIIDDENAN